MKGGYRGFDALTKSEAKWEADAKNRPHDTSDRLPWRTLTEDRYGRKVWRRTSTSSPTPNSIRSEWAPRDVATRSDASTGKADQ